MVYKDFGIMPEAARPHNRGFEKGAYAWPPSKGSSASVTSYGSCQTYGMHSALSSQSSPSSPWATIRVRAAGVRPNSRESFVIVSTHCFESRGFKDAPDRLSNTVIVVDGCDQIRLPHQEIPLCMPGIVHDPRAAA